MDGSTTIKNETVSVIYGKWGLSYTKHHFIGYWDDPSQGNFPHEELNVESLAVNYSFGENLTFTIGIPVYAKGEAVIHDYANGVEVSQFKPKKGPGDLDLFGGSLLFRLIVSSQ